MSKEDRVRRNVIADSKQDILFPHKLIKNYIVENPHICRGVHLVDLLIIVHTAPGNFDQRSRIRQTFANQSLFLPFQIRVAFLLGRTENVTQNTKMLAYNREWRDLVIGDFLDSYHNLTVKGVMGYRWVSKHCSNARHILKIDDDVLVNTYKLLYFLANHMTHKERSIICNVWRQNKVPIDRKGKWNIDRRLFARQTRYPYTYCSGYFVLFTRDLMAPLYLAAKLAPFFWVDDVYLYGMLPYLVGNITYYSFRNGELLSLDRRDFQNCINLLEHRCPLFSGVVYRHSFWQLWKKMKDFMVLVDKKLELELCQSIEFCGCCEIGKIEV